MEDVVLPFELHVEMALWTGRPDGPLERATNIWLLLGVLRFYTVLRFCWEQTLLLLGHIFPIFAYCGLVLEIQPLNC